MDLTSIIVTLAIGAIAGWLAGQIFQGRGLGTVGNIVAGVLGGVVGGWLLGRLGLLPSFGSAIVNTIVTSTIGAVVILFLVSLIKRA